MDKWTLFTKACYAVIWLDNSNEIALVQAEQAYRAAAKKFGP